MHNTDNLSSENTRTKTNVIHCFFVLLAVAVSIGGYTGAAIASPTLQAMIDHNWIQGYGFAANTDVTVTINGGLKGSFTVGSESDGGFFAGA